MSAAVLLAVTAIEVRGAKEKKRSAAATRRSEVHMTRRAEESRLSMELIDASVSLSVATAIAIAEGKCNGEMANARDKAKTAQEAYDAFLWQTTAEQCAKI